ncbi:MAG: hypothetical protein ACLQPD_19035 [Desulfomonilaceae bacterium]
MGWLDWLRGKANAQGMEPTKTTPKSAARQKGEVDPRELLWKAESSSAMRSLISGMTDQQLTNLVAAVQFAELPLNALAVGGRSLDKRSTLAVHFTFQLFKSHKRAQADQLLTKIVDKMRAKLAAGAREGGVLSQEGAKAFESAFRAGDIGSATEILKQNRSVDFWRIGEVEKSELYELALELLTPEVDKPREAAILLDAVMLDYPRDLQTEFWRAAAYHNIFNKNKSDAQAKEIAKQAIGSFLRNASSNSGFSQQCSTLKKLMSEY